MLKPESTTACLCCNQVVESHLIPANGVICVNCVHLSANDATIKAVRSELARQAMLTGSRAGRRDVKRQSKLDSYIPNGKRCSACHARKPAEDYAKCQPTTDGLQPICKACNNTKDTLLRHGSTLATWRTIRDALRLQNENKP